MAEYKTILDKSTGQLKRVALDDSAAEQAEIDPTDLAAVKAMVWSKLVQIAAVMPANAQGLPILREIMDRLDGKPAQMVQIDATMRHVTVNANIRFADQPMVIDQTQLRTTSSDDVKAIDKQ